MGRIYSLGEEMTNINAEASSGTLAITIYQLIIRFLSLDLASSSASLEFCNDLELKLPPKDFYPTA
jgi:hypothetical protein